MQNKDAIGRIQRQRGRQDMLIAEKGRSLASIDDNATVVGNDNAVMSILNDLQREYATGSVQLYSELLTSMVRSVIPDYAHEIVLKPSVYANKPALDIAAVNENGEEELIDDQGGSISNLLASGLRFIGLALSSNRRIAILDESDCWLESALVPKFLKVIHEMCVRLGLQVVFVSHHHNALDELGIAKIRLANRDGVTIVTDIEQATITTDAEPDHAVYAHTMKGSGIRYMRLRNFMSHEDSIIPLQPGLTALVGENNIGKSVITRAFSDLVSNNRNAKRIRRGENESSVELGLESGYVLTWQLNTRNTGQPTGSYSLLDSSGDIVHIERHVTSTPEWLHDYLAMGEVNGLNLHIGHQKDPLFILNPAISRHKRAELIHLGDEYDKINRMLKQHRLNIAEAKRGLKDEKARADSLSEELSTLSPLDMLEMASQPIKYMPQQTLKSLESFFEQKTSGVSANQIRLILRALETDIPSPHEESVLKQFLALTECESDSINSLEPALSAFDAPFISSAENTLRTMQSFAKARKNALAHSQSLSLHRAFNVALSDTSNQAGIFEFADLQKKLDEQQSALYKSQRELESIEKQLIDSGNVCPTCRQFTVTSGENYAHSHH